MSDFLLSGVELTLDLHCRAELAQLRGTAGNLGLRGGSVNLRSRSQGISLLLPTLERRDFVFELEHIRMTGLVANAKIGSSAFNRVSSSSTVAALIAAPLL